MDLQRTTSRDERDERLQTSSRKAQAKADAKTAEKHLAKVGPMCGEGVMTGQRCRFFEMGRCKHLGPADGMTTCTAQEGHKGLEAFRIYCGCSLKRQGKKWGCSFEQGQSPYAFCSLSVNQDEL